MILRPLYFKVYSLVKGYWVLWVGVFIRGLGVLGVWGLELLSG